MVIEWNHRFHSQGKQVCLIFSNKSQVSLLSTFIFPFLFTEKYICLWLVEIYILSQDQLEEYLSLVSFTNSQPSIIFPFSVTLCILFRTVLLTEGFLKRGGHKINITLNATVSIPHTV